MKTYIAAMKELEAKFKSVTGRRPSAFRVHPEVYRTIEKEVFGVVSEAFPVAADDKDVREAFGAQFSAAISIRGIRVIGDPDIQPDTVACGIYYRTVAAK